MTDLISPILDILTRLWDCSAKRLALISELKEKLNSLRNTADQLHNVWLDVQMRVQLAEQQHQKRLNAVEDWILRVEATEKEVQLFLQNSDQEIQNKCLGGYCPKNFRATNKMGKKVNQMISKVQKLAEEGDFEVVAQNMPHALVDEMPLEKNVGLESAFDELCTYFGDSSIGIVGLYGMGGVGKTTLLKKFINEFLATKNHGFDVVIWVVESKEADLKKVQQVIRDKLHVPDYIWVKKTMEERAIVLYNILNKKRFVLLLDDIWKRIDLLKLGVPIPDNQNKSKVIFTTRSEQVCYHMEADRLIKVECLTSEKAFELFIDKVGQDALNSHINIPRLAKIVAEECKGLPLALCTVGRSMANKKTPDEWKRVVKILRSYPSRFSGMIDDVYRLLEFSYDMLPSDTHRSCFLYCSLFPEDYNIRKGELVELWIGEGFLPELDDDIYEARSQGEDIITTLKLACLLESGSTKGCVKMHEVIRDMALWLASDHGSKTKFLVKDGAASAEANKHERWKEVEKVSFWGSCSQIVMGKPDFPNLQTMLVRVTEQSDLLIEITGFAYALKVLDLSSQVFQELPAEIGKLVNLQYLNLSGTNIRELPTGMGKLRNLRCLMLNYGIYPPAIPEGVISSLSSLQMLNALPLEIENGGFKDETSLVRELDSLENIQDISIALYHPSSIQILLNSPRLQRCIKYLYVSSKEYFCNMTLERVEHLEVLHIYGCKILTFDMEKETSQRCIVEYIPQSSELNTLGYIISLRKLRISAYEGYDLNWLIYARSLQSLEIRGSVQLKEVISVDFPQVQDRDILTSLTTLRLLHLYNLGSICRQELRFPCLKKIKVINCPSLTKLPVDSKSSTNNLMRIEGEQSW